MKNGIFFVRRSFQSRTQSPLAFLSADGRPSADQKARGHWVRDYVPSVVDRAEKRVRMYIDQRLKTQAQARAHSK